MKLLYAHDHKFLFDGRFYYSRSSFPQSVLNRYLKEFESLVFISRVVEVESCNSLPPIDNQRISIVPQVNIRSVKYIHMWGEVKRNISKYVEECDAVIVRLPSTLGLLAIKEARRKRKPYLIEVVGDALESEMMHGHLLGKISGPITHMATKKEVRRASYVCYITESHLQRIYPTRGNEYICPNVEIEEVNQDSVRFRIVRRKKKQAIRIGLIGSLDVDYKGHEVALQVIKKLRNKGFDITIEFLGSGDKKRWVKQVEELGISESVVFKGVLPAGLEVMSWIDTQDVIFQPSKTEAQGRAIIEAMSRGCPVVASNVGGIPELISKEMMTSPSNIEGFVSIFEILLSDEHFFEKIIYENLLNAKKYLTKTIEESRSKMLADFKREIKG